jgi:hypothetical protein
MSDRTQDEKGPKPRRVPNTAKVRRGLAWVCMTAETDFEATMDDHTRKEREEITSALRWLRDNSR